MCSWLRRCKVRQTGSPPPSLLCREASRGPGPWQLRRLFCSVCHLSSALGAPGKSTSTEGTYEQGQVSLPASSLGVRPQEAVHSLRPSCSQGQAIVQRTHAGQAMTGRDGGRGSPGAWGAGPRIRTQWWLSFYFLKSNDIPSSLLKDVCRIVKCLEDNW